MDQQHGYGARQNRYEQLGNTNDYYGGQQQQQQQQGYGQNPSYQQNYGQGNNTTGGSNFEMAPLGPPTGRSGEMGDPILAEVKVIRDSTDKINRSIGEIETLVDKHLMAVDHSPRRVEQLDMMFAAAAAENGTVLERIRTLMSQIPAEHRLAGQVITRKTALTEAVSRLRACENKYRMGIEAQMAKQIKIACPEMDDRQVRQIVENGGTENVMQMAMNSQRNARANSALSNVRSRNQEIKKIERQVEELAALFMQLDEMVFQQEAFVQKAEQHTEEANDNLDKGNVEMNVAVQSARGTRKKKWICLGICVAILVVIIIIVLVYIFVIKGTTGNKSSKRELEDITGTLVSNVISHAKRFESRRAIDEELAQQMARISRLRIHYPQMANN